MPSYGGFNPQDMIQKGNPWHNPYSAAPDFGAGIRDYLNQMWQMREYRRRQELEQRQWEEKQALETRRVAADEKQSAAMENYYKAQAIGALGRANNATTPISPVAIRSMGAALKLTPEVIQELENSPPERQGQALDEYLAMNREIHKQERINAGPLAESARTRADIARAEAERKRVDALRKQQGGMLVGASTMIQQLRQPLLKQMETIDKNPMYLGSERDNAKAQLQRTIDNIEQAAGEIAAYNATLAAGYDLPDEAVAKVKRYLSNPNKIKSGEIWLEDVANPSGMNTPSPTTAPPKPGAVWSPVKKGWFIQKPDGTWSPVK